MVLGTMVGSAMLTSCASATRKTVNESNLIAGTRTGKWFIEVDNKGVYELIFYRRQPVSGLTLNKPAKEKSGKLRGAIPVAATRLRIAQFDETVQTKDGQTNTKFTVSLEKGRYELETMLCDNNGKDLCSAYYTRVELKNIE